MCIVDIECTILRKHAPLRRIIGQIPRFQVGIDDGNLLRILMSEGKRISTRKCNERPQRTLIDAIEHYRLARIVAILLCRIYRIDFKRAIVALPSNGEPIGTTRPSR